MRSVRGVRGGCAFLLAGLPRGAGTPAHPPTLHFVLAILALLVVLRPGLVRGLGSDGSGCQVGRQLGGGQQLLLSIFSQTGSTQFLLPMVNLVVSGFQHDSRLGLKMSQLTE